MPSSITRARLHKAFNEGRRSAATEVAENPYDNPKLRALWDQGRKRQRAGEIAAPLPPLAHGERRAARAPRGPAAAARPPRPVVPGKRGGARGR